MRYPSSFYRVLIFLMAFATIYSCNACGGGGGKPESTATTGGGLPDNTLPATSFEPPSPTALYGVTIPGLWFGINNATDSDIVAYAWWETRNDVPAGMPGNRWYNLVPIGGVPPGQTHILVLGANGRPWYEPARGLLSVRAYLRDGRTIDAKINYEPDIQSVWLVK